MGNINLDHISSNPILPEVQEVMIEAIKKNYGNPSSQTTSGDESTALIQEAREAVRQLINAEHTKEIAFTSGGTESINHAIKGAAYANADKGKHIIISNIEHNAVIRSAKRLKMLGYKVTSISVDKDGRVDPEEIAGAITDETILVSIMHSNNEIGTIQPIKEISEITKPKKILLHVDAVDSVGIVPVDVQDLGVDLLSFASNSFNGPTGVGGIYIKRGVAVWPLLDGGVQENNKRAGTENLIGIIGMGKAAEFAYKELDKRFKHLKNLKDLMLKELPGYIDDYIINGHSKYALPNHISISIKYIEGESILLMLDDENITVSTRSACATGSLRASHVLLSIGLSHADAQGTLVLTLGHENTRDDVINFLKALKDVVISLRDMSPLYRQSR